MKGTSGADFPPLLDPEIRGGARAIAIAGAVLFLIVAVYLGTVLTAAQLP